MPAPYFSLARAAVWNGRRDMW